MGDIYGGGSAKTGAEGASEFAGEVWERMNISNYIECRGNKFFRTVEQTGLYLIVLLFVYTASFFEAKYQILKLMPAKFIQ